MQSSRIIADAVTVLHKPYSATMLYHIKGFVFLKKKVYRRRGGSDLDPGQFMFRRRKATFKVVVHGISEENPHTVNLPHKALCQKLQGDANRREGERLDMHRKTSLSTFKVKLNVRNTVFWV
ncbi:hypothetical protein D5086_025900 [Populus alba]|uniref:Uncharacterized protein n=1 Tax=Populus alba TaxID=43335 RepID=A0ACC4B0Y8_POPAL